MATLRACLGCETCEHTVTEPSDEFISALLRDSSALDLDVGSAYEGVTRRVQHVKRRRAALLSGTACIALFAAVVFAGSRMGAPDDVQPGGPATDQRGDLVPDSGATTTSTTEPIPAAVAPATVTSAESMETVPVAASTPAGSAPTQSGGSSDTSPSTGSSDDNTPGTSDDDDEQSGDDGSETTDDGDHSGSDSSDSSGSGSGGGDEERRDDGRSDGDGESGGD